jgi:hypothetical protein
MQTVDTMAVIRSAREELKEQVKAREFTDRRIAELRILLRSLVRFMPEQSHRDEVLAEVERAKRKVPSLALAIDDLLMKNPGGMTSAQIREALEQSGFDLEDYSQPLAAIMTTLNKMVESDTVKRTLGKEKTIVFRNTTLAKSLK